MIAIGHRLAVFDVPEKRNVMFVMTGKTWYGYEMDNANWKELAQLNGCLEKWQSCNVNLPNQANPILQQNLIERKHSIQNEPPIEIDDESSNDSDLETMNNVMLKRRKLINQNLSYKATKTGKLPKTNTNRKTPRKPKDAGRPVTLIEAETSVQKILDDFKSNKMKTEPRYSDKYKFIVYNVGNDKQYPDHDLETIKEIIEKTGQRTIHWIKCKIVLYRHMLKELNNWNGKKRYLSKDILHQFTRRSIEKYKPNPNLTASNDNNELQTDVNMQKNNVTITQWASMSQNERNSYSDKEKWDIWLKLSEQEREFLQDTERNELTKYFYGSNNIHITDNLATSQLLHIYDKIRQDRSSYFYRHISNSN